MNTTNENANQSQRHIPDFTSRQEAAEWWETHNLADFLDEVQPVEMGFADDFKSEYRGTGSASKKSLKQPLESLTLRLPVPTIVALRRRASQKGIGTTTLARIILVETLHGTQVNRSKI
jgi:hypothetical protein